MKKETFFYSTNSAIKTTYQRIEAGKKKLAMINSLIEQINSVDFSTLWDALFILEQEGIKGTIVKDINLVPADYWAPERIWFNGVEIHSRDGLKELDGVRLSKGEHFRTFNDEIKSLKKALFTINAVLSAYGR